MRHPSRAPSGADTFDMSSTQPGSRSVPAVVALCTAAVLLWPSPARALDPSLDITQYAHLAWTFRNGFSNGAVYAIAQTPDGYLWLGTSSGVMRYDGARLTPLPLGPGHKLPNAASAAILPARDGSVWIGTLDGLVSWKNGELTHYPVFAGRTVITLLQQRDGTVWAGSFGGPTGKLCAFRGEQTTCYGDDGELGGSVASLYEDGDGSLWVGAGTGLWRWAPGAPARYLATPIQTHQSLTQGDRGRGVLVAVDGIRQVAGTEVVDYPLRGVPSPLTLQACFGIATVDCGLAQPLMGSCTHTRAKQACSPTKTACRATRCWPCSRTAKEQSGWARPKVSIDFVSGRSPHFR